MLSTSEPNILHKIVANPKIIFCHVGCLFMNIQALGVSLGLPHELAFLLLPFAQVWESPVLLVPLSHMLGTKYLLAHLGLLMGNNLLHNYIWWYNPLIGGTAGPSMDHHLEMGHNFQDPLARRDPKWSKDLSIPFSGVSYFYPPFYQVFFPKVGCFDFGPHLSQNGANESYRWPCRERFECWIHR
jgi:hypothetical protein